MSGLDDHKTLTAATDVTSGLSGTALRDRMNDNYDTLIAAAQGVENRLEDVAYEMFSSGVLSGMVATVGSGLNIDVTSGTALVGILVDYAGGSVSVPASQTDASVYFAQDGNFYTSIPTGQAYFTFCTYSSDGSSVTSVGTTTKVLPPQMVTITDTFTNLHVGSSHELIYEIDHSATNEFLIPGFITLTVSPSTAFSVEQTNMNEVTGTVFDVKITRNDSYHEYDDYYYVDSENHGEYALCDLTFTRKGFAFN